MQSSHGEQMEEPVPQFVFLCHHGEVKAVLPEGDKLRFPSAWPLDPQSVELEGLSGLFNSDGWTKLTFTSIRRQAARLPTPWPADKGEGANPIKVFGEPREAVAAAAARSEAAAAASRAEVKGQSELASAACETPLELAKALMTTFKLRNNKQGHVVDMAKRSGPLHLVDGQTRLEDVGQYLALSSYDRALDHLLRSMSRMARAFDIASVDSFIMTVQLLRAVGAPGLGKSTFIKFAWSMLQQRLKEVKADTQRWLDWQALGVDQLQERLDASWQTPFGPLVYAIDLSDQDLKEVHHLEKGLGSEVQIAARMLWAAAEHRTCKAYGYNEFLFNLRSMYPQWLHALTPLAVQYFVHMSAGLDPSTPSIEVLVCDEANVVQARQEDTATFFQAQLSAVVASRKAALQRKQQVNVLLVLVVASTRGSAMSLINTASKKAGCTDLRLPLIRSVDEMALIVVDLVRRLPLPHHHMLRRAVSQERPLSAMSVQERNELAQLCPAQVRLLLGWVGNNPRLLAAALCALSTGNASCEQLEAGDVTWFTSESSLPLHGMLEKLLQRMKAQGWDRWLAGGSRRPLARILLEVTTYGLCNVRVNRTQAVAQPSGITIEQLEADGVIELWPPGGAAPCSRSSSAGGADPVADVNPEMLVVLPPTLLVAILRDIASIVHGSAHLSFSHLLASLSNNWRMREYDDVGALTLRLQLLRHCFQYPAVQLQTLFSLLASTDLGDQWVAVPSEGFSPVTEPKKVDEADVATLVQHVAWPQTYPKKEKQPPPWAFVFNGNSGPGDSMVVLRMCDSVGQLSGELVVIHLQSKLRSGEEPPVASWDRIDGEAAKVFTLGSIRGPGGESVVPRQVLLYISDERLPLNGKRLADGLGEQLSVKRSSRSDAGSSLQQPASSAVGLRQQQAAMASGSNQLPQPAVDGKAKLAQLGRGECEVAKNQLEVFAVFRDSQWQLRGAVERLKKLLDDEMQAQKKLDRERSVLSQSSKMEKQKKKGRKPGR